MDNKRFYEKCLDRKISDSTWNRDKALMKVNGFLINKENLKTFADIKNQSQKFSLPIAATIKYFLSIRINNRSTGIDIYFKLLSFLPCQPHRTTLNRWFPGGYQPERFYTPPQISEILLHAFIYKLRIEKDATGKKANRSRQVSFRETRT